MQAFDTLKIQVPVETVRSVNWQAFTETVQTNNATGAEERFSKANHSALPVGVSAITYKDGSDFQLTISAKTLKDNYLQGITLNTIEQALSAAAPVMQIDANGLLQTGAKVYRCDSTNNISRAELNHATQLQVCQALLAGKANDRFVPKWYYSKSKLGVEFAGTQQERNRLIAYAKNLDLLKMENKTFMKSLKNPALMMADAEKMIRFEVNHTAFASMRQRFQVADNTLLDLLQSNAPVNHNFLAKVLNVARTKQINLFDEFEQFKGAGIEFIMLKGIETIITDLDCNEVAIKQFFKQVFGEQYKYHFYKKKNSIKELMTKLKAKQHGSTQQQVGTLCNLCLDALLKAVA